MKLIEASEESVQADAEEVGRVKVKEDDDLDEHRLEYRSLL